MFCSVRAFHVTILLKFPVVYCFKFRWTNEKRPWLKVRRNEQLLKQMQNIVAWSEVIVDHFLQIHNVRISNLKMPLNSTAAGTSSIIQQMHPVQSYSTVQACTGTRLYWSECHKLNMTFIIWSYSYLAYIIIWFALVVPLSDHNGSTTTSRNKSKNAIDCYFNMNGKSLKTVDIKTQKRLIHLNCIRRESGLR